MAAMALAPIPVHHHRQSDAPNPMEGGTMRHGWFHRSQSTPRGTETAVLQAKANLLDDMANELRLYRGFCVQFDSSYANSRLFAPLAAYDALVGKNVTNGQ